ncbi:MAG: SDR family oxidoreductase [Polyangiaceae bacterium]|nr:SDR family oxidoreductase [Polyangiaceae bacterium]
MDKTIFITGAASGIGKATAFLFAKHNFTVGCYDIDIDGARRVAEQIGHGAHHGRIDVTQEESWKAAVDDFSKVSGGALGVLFNCAGIMRMGRFEDVPPAECQKQLDINVMGTVLGIRTCLPLLEKGHGTVVNMSSAAAIYGQPEQALYSASKFAVRAITEALDIEFRSKGVRVVDVMPSYVDTHMVQSQVHRARSLSHLGVKLKAEDVAETVWKATHGTGLHYFPQLDFNILARLNGAFPEAARLVMGRIITK